MTQWGKAVSDFSKVIELDPGNKSAYSNREFAYSKLKNANTKLPQDVRRP